jgi:hypothetical protein
MNSEIPIIVITDADNGIQSQYSPSMLSNKSFATDDSKPYYKPEPEQGFESSVAKDLFESMDGEY